VGLIHIGPDLEPDPHTRGAMAGHTAEKEIVTMVDSIVKTEIYEN
jgi:hypothetical protein